MLRQSLRSKDEEILAAKRSIVELREGILHLSERLLPDTADTSPNANVDFDAMTVAVNNLKKENSDFAVSVEVDSLFFIGKTRFPFPIFFVQESCAHLYLCKLAFSFTFTPTIATFVDSFQPSIILSSPLQRLREEIARREVDLATARRAHEEADLRLEAARDELKDALATLSIVILFLKNLMKLKNIEMVFFSG